jgi:hypothetical protein
MVQKLYFLSFFFFFIFLPYFFSLPFYFLFFFFFSFFFSVALLSGALALLLQPCSCPAKVGCCPELLTVCHPCHPANTPLR